MKRVRRRLSVHTSSLDQHHEMKKHNVLPTLRNCKEEIKNHFDGVEFSSLKDEHLTEIVADNSQSVEDHGIIDLNAGVDTSEIQHDLKTTPEIRSSHSVRKILTAVSKLKFFKRLKCKETLQQLAAKGTYLRLPKNSIVYAQGSEEDGVYVVLSGSIKMLEKLPELDLEEKNVSHDAGQPAEPSSEKNYDNKIVKMKTRPHTTKNRLSRPQNFTFDKNSRKSTKQTKFHKSKTSSLLSPHKHLSTATVKTATRLLGRRRSIHHMVGTGGIGKNSKLLSGSGMYHDTAVNRTKEHDDDAYKYLGQRGPGDCFGEKERLYSRTSNLRAFSTKVAVDGTELFFIDHKTYETIMNGKDKRFVHSVQAHLNALCKSSKLNVSALMAIDSMLSDNHFFTDMKHNSTALRHRCISKFRSVFVERGKLVVKSHQRSMYAYVCLSGIAKSVGIDPDESNLDKSWIYPGDVLGLEELLSEELIKCNYVAHKDTLFAAIPRNAYYELFKDIKSREQKELRDWLRHIMPGLKDFTSAQLGGILRLFKRVSPRQGEVIEHENAPCSNIYIVKEGSVVVQQNLVGDEMPKRQVKVTNLAPGAYFGVAAHMTTKMYNSTYLSGSNLTIIMKIHISDFSKKIPKGDIHHLFKLEKNVLVERDCRHAKFQQLKSRECDRDISIKATQGLGEYRDISTNPRHAYTPYEPTEKKERLKSIKKQIFQNTLGSFYSPLKASARSGAPTFSSASKFETYNPHFRPRGKKRAIEGQLEQNRAEARLLQIEKESGPKPIDLRNENSVLTTDYLKTVLDLSKVVPPNWLNKHSGTMWKDAGFGKPKKLPRVTWNDDDKVRLYYADTKAYKTEAKKRKEHLRAFGKVNPDVTHKIRQRIEDTIKPGYLKWIDP